MSSGLFTSFIETAAQAAAAELLKATGNGPSKDGADAAPVKRRSGGAIPPGRSSGYKPMEAAPDARLYEPQTLMSAAELPAKVDLRGLMTPVEDQGDTNSCVAHAVTSAYEYWIKKTSHHDHNVSRLFVYYNARWRDGSQDKDDGSVIQFAMDGLSKFGACAETLWPYDPKLTLKRPTPEAYTDAATFRVHDMAQMPLKLAKWKQALAEGKPVVFGCELFDSFDSCSTRGGVVPMPAPSDLKHAEHSSHAMCAVGYSDSEKVFIVRNSWGSDWGDAGYCYMPYAYLMSAKFNDGDCWVFVPKIPIDPPHDAWSQSNAPVTNGGKGVDFPIETYTVEDYARVAIDFFRDVRHPFNARFAEKYGKYALAIGLCLWEELRKDP